MTKTEEIEKLKTELAEKVQQLDDLNQMQRDGIWISNGDYNHYQELQRNTLSSIEKADKLQDANTELIKAIANLNGGVLKDLSQTIVNLTKSKL